MSRKAAGASTPGKTVPVNGLVLGFVVCVVASGISIILSILFSGADPLFSPARSGRWFALVPCARACSRVRLAYAAYIAGPLVQCNRYFAATHKNSQSATSRAGYARVVLVSSGVASRGRLRGWADSPPRPFRKTTPSAVYMFRLFNDCHVTEPRQKYRHHRSGVPIKVSLDSRGGSRRFAWTPQRAGIIKKLLT